MYDIPLFKSFAHADDLEAVEKIFSRSMYWADGPEIRSFEERVAIASYNKYACVMNSGTSALLSLLLAIDIKDSEVICPSFTFIATANAIELAGGTPVFVDAEADTFGVDIESCIAAITKKTKAIITINYGGCVCKNTLALKELAKKNNILYIEDSAQSFGATAYGRPAGSFSDAAIFSFCQNKVITCFGEGGAVVTNNEDLKNRINYLRSHGRVEEIGTNYFDSTVENEYLYPGYNFRMSTVQAAFGLSQLNNLEEQLSLRRENAKRYNENLSEFNDITIPIVPDNFTHCYQMYSVQFKNRETREKVRKHLLKNGVHVRVYFEPLHLKKYYVNKYGNKKLPVSEKLVDTILSLPMYAQLSLNQIDYISELIGASLNDNISCETI